MVRQGIAVLLASIAWSALAAGQNTKPPTAPEREVAGPTDPVKVPSAVAADTVGQPIDPKTYVIGPEDILRITVWREPDLSGIKGVRPDGKITMPLIGDLQAAGLTPERLTAQLKQGLSEFVKQLEITVEIIQVNSKSYSITGEVNRPGRYPLVVSKTVFEAINDAGGFREFGNQKDVVILRKDGTRLHFNYKEYVAGKHQEKNVAIENSDTILVK